MLFACDMLCLHPQYAAGRRIGSEQRQKEPHADKISRQREVEKAATPLKINRLGA